jgi:hypothetical protein
LSVTGTQQRVYGTLVAEADNCNINIRRFALVSGSTTQSPTEASTVTYADTTPYRQCGYKYDGYLTLFLSISGSTVYAAVEVRICKNDAKRIVIETYGEVAKTITGGMALWFNKGTDKHFPTRDDFPETGSSDINYIDDATGKYYIWNETVYEEGSCWVKLNSTTSGVIMPYATTSYTFKESKRNGSITIDCCKKCPSCGCKNCDVSGRFTVYYYSFLARSNCCEYLTISSIIKSQLTLTSYMYGLKKNGDYTLYNSSENIYIEYKLNCNTIDIYIYSLCSDTVSKYNRYYEVYYRDDDGENNLIFEGITSDMGCV